MFEADFNPHSATDRQMIMVASAFGSVAEHFSHIAIRDIINPPSRSYLDAYFARQIAWTILVRDFQVPCKRVEKLQANSVGSVHRSVRYVQERCGCPVFTQAYNKMAARAHELFQATFEEAAA